MRFLLACLAVIFALGLASPASAQSFPPGPWRGTWTTSSNPGYEYQAELNFTMEISGAVHGQIRWMLVRAPNAEEWPKIGARAVEYVEGTFDPSVGALTLRGTRTEDASHIIGQDVYRLAVSPDASSIAGITEDNGTWRGRIDLVRQAN